MCISIIVGHSGSGNNAVIYFNATDGNRSLYGDRAFGWGGMGTPTDAEYTAMVTPYVLSWFGATAVDLCSYVPPATYDCINGQCTEITGGLYIDPTCAGVCKPTTVTDNTGLYVMAIGVLAGIFLLFRGKT